MQGGDARVVVECPQEVGRVEWLDKMNDALRYLEDNLRGKVDHREAARIACSSLRRFQRMFEFVTDMTVDEYLRRRRMALAARDLVESDIRIIDVAARYGYESPDAFSRAFRAFHGASPTEVRKTGALREFPPIVFRAEGGKYGLTLGERTLIRLEELSCRAVEFRADGAAPETDAWNRLRAWAVANLGDYAVRRYVGFAPRGHHPDGGDESAHEYCAMMLLNGGEGADGEFHGAKVTEAPQGLFLVGDVVLNEYTDSGEVDIGASMTAASRTIYECMTDMGGYELDFGGRAFLEEHIFRSEWFTADEHEKILPEWRFWLPVRRA